MMGQVLEALVRQCSQDCSGRCICTRLVEGSGSTSSLSQSPGY